MTDLNLSLTNLTKVNNTGTFTVLFSKADNGIIIDITDNTNFNPANVYNVKPIRLVFSGTLEEIKTKIIETIDLNKILTIDTVTEG